MGHPSNLSRAVNVFRTANQQKIKDLKHQLHVCKRLTPFASVECPSPELRLPIQ